MTPTVAITALMDSTMSQAVSRPLGFLLAITLFCLLYLKFALARSQR